MTSPLAPASVLGGAFVLALALVGCVGQDAGVDTMPLDVPPAAELLPENLEGFALGHQAAIPSEEATFAGFVDGHTRIFDGQVNGTSVQLVVSALRFQDDAAAHAAWSRVDEELTLQPNATHPMVGDAPDAVELLQPFHQGSSVLAVRKSSVLWMLQHAVRGPDAPLPDLVAVAEPLVAKLLPRP